MSKARDNADGGANELPDLIDCTVSTSDPAANSNPTSGAGHFWVNKTSGNVYVLTDATAGANLWTNVGNGTDNIGPFIATGGTITTAGGYTYHTFTSSGTFTITQGATVGIAGDILMVGGGGSGGGGGYAYDPFHNSVPTPDASSGGGGGGGDAMGGGRGGWPMIPSWPVYARPFGPAHLAWHT